MIVFQISLNFDPAKEMLKLRYFTEESDYSEKNTSENTSGLSLHHSSTIYKLSLNKKKTCGNESHERETTEAVVLGYSSK